MISKRSILFKAENEKIEASKRTDLGLEVYSRKRYFTMTGELFNGIASVRERTERVKQLVDGYGEEDEDEEMGPLSSDPDRSIDCDLTDGETSDDIGYPEGENGRSEEDDSEAGRGTDKSDGSGNGSSGSREREEGKGPGRSESREPEKR